MTEPGPLRAGSGERWIYQGLLRSAASWARVGRGYLSAAIRAGVDVAAISARGFGYDSGFPLPQPLPLLTPAAARQLRDPFVGLGFLHPPRIDRLLGQYRVNLFVWEADLAPTDWSEALTKGCDRVAVPSEFTRDALVAAGTPREQIVVAGYGHELDPALAVEPPPATGPFRFVAVVAPHWRKGIRELLAAYSAAFDASDDVELVIKSTYDPAESTRRFAFEIPGWRQVLEHAGLERARAPRVDLRVISTSDAHVLDVLRSAHVVVQPSQGEAFGLVIHDAAALGRPVITADWSAPREYLPRSDDLLPVRLCEAGDAIYTPVPGARLAVVDVDALTARLRWHYENRGLSLTRGEGLRAQVLQRTWSQAWEELAAALQSDS